MKSLAYLCGAVVLLFIGVTSTSWAQSVEQQVPLRRAEVKRLVASANSSDEFRRLAAYFEQQSRQYEQKARQEQKELDWLHGLFFHARIYAIQLETTQNRYGDDQKKASEYAAESATFQQRANASPAQTTESVPKN